MKRVRQTVIGAAGLGVALLSSQASAAPSCTGTTTTITSPTALSDSFLVNAAGQSNGNCVAAGDKLFGNFTFGLAGSQLPFAGQIVQFNFPTTTPAVGNYQISFSTNLSNATASQFGYEVMTTDPTVAVINDLQKDASFNGVAGSSISLVGSINGAQLINCARTQGGAATCPAIANFTPIQMETRSPCWDSPRFSKAAYSHQPAPGRGPPLLTCLIAACRYRRHSYRHRRLTSCLNGPSVLRGLAGAAP
jgi:hypothetical protein